MLPKKRWSRLLAGRLRAMSFRLSAEVARGGFRVMFGRSGGCMLIEVSQFLFLHHSRLVFGFRCMDNKQNLRVLRAVLPLSSCTARLVSSA